MTQPTIQPAFDFERPYSGYDPEFSRVPQVTVGGVSLQVTGQTIQLQDLGTTALTSATTIINAASIVLPKNLAINNLGLLVTVAGTVTGFWQALVTRGFQVIAVSANTTAPTTGFFNQSVVPSSLVPTLTPYAGHYYHVFGTVSSVAPQVGAAVVAPSAAALAGPPVYAGTFATAASATPPAVGATLATLTGTTTGLFYGQVS